MHVINARTAIAGGINPGGVSGAASPAMHRTRRRSPTMRVAPSPPPSPSSHQQQQQQHLQQQPPLVGLQETPLLLLQEPLLLGQPDIEETRRRCIREENSKLCSSDNDLYSSMFLLIRLVLN